VVPIWHPTKKLDIELADERSKRTTSTDEWGVSRVQLQEIFQAFEVSPTVDAFASSDNTVCTHFFSRWPQAGGSGVNFFAQQLNTQDIYFCCPPVKLISHTIRRLQRFAQVRAILLFPAWSGHPFWSLLKKGDKFIPEIQEHKMFEAQFQDTGCGKSLFTRKQGTVVWVALWTSGKTEQVIEKSELLGRMCITEIFIRPIKKEYSVYYIRVEFWFTAGQIEAYLI